MIVCVVVVVVVQSVRPVVYLPTACTDVHYRVSLNPEVQRTQTGSVFLHALKGVVYLILKC